MTQTPPPTPPILRRTLRVLHAGGLAVMAPDAGHDPLGRRTVFVFAPGQAAGQTAGQTALPEIRPAPGTAQSARRDMGGCAILQVQPLGAAPAALAIGDTVLELPPPEDDSALFAGRNVLLGSCNGDSAATVAGWLGWHAGKHGADAALILVRGTPAEADALAAGLAQALHDRPVPAAMTIAVVALDCPLGLPDQGNERLPFYAPDAPGKDRMEAPVPDPWHSPLGFRPVFQLLREVWLGRAGAVANLEVVDLVPRAPDAPDMFALAGAAPKGVLILSGERVYPWGSDETPGFGDHICHRFDGSERDHRWCVSLASHPHDTLWMPYRILGPRAPAAPVAQFWRCMALRYGAGGKTSQIVPKTSLVEDPRLLVLPAFFGTDPKRIPEDQKSGARNLLPVGEAKGNRTAIVTTMKNEGPFILEWLAWHRAIGVEDFLIYTNDCTDGTDTFLDLLARKGYVSHRDNPYREMNLKPQHAALEAANSAPEIVNADWVVCMDVDEFIQIQLGEGRLADLYAAVPSANMISMTWRLFGNSDIHDYRDEFITQAFTRCAREATNKPHQAWGFKTLFRNIGLFRKLGVHRPKGLRPNAVERIDWVNGSGKAMPQKEWRTAWRSHSGTYGYDLVQLNHYAVRSAESFLVKRDRGRVNHVDRDQGGAYWFRMNHNVTEDTRARRMAPLLEAEYARLMADPEIAAAHRACVAAHRAKIDELRASPNYAAFYDELTGPRMENLARLHGHFGGNVYLAGPSCIPDEIAMKPPEETFFFTVDEVSETQH